MANAMCRKRLQQELVALGRNPVEYIESVPLERNILEWHYAIEGPPDSPYAGGTYHGVLRFPSDYPFKPPAILMFTKNGRFKTHTRLCLSMSDFHPETWNPIWSVSSILSGLLSFMLDSTSTVGSIETSAAQKRLFAARSMEENIKNKEFCSLFPHLVEKYQKEKAATKTSADKVSSRPVSGGSAEPARNKENANDLKGQDGPATSGIPWWMILSALGVAALASLYILVT